MFTIDALPAQQGDALWIEYGSKTAPHRILVDGGTPPTEAFLRARIEALDPKNRTFELLIVTHIDTDHIGGILRLLDDPPEGLSFRDVWFNGWPQLEPLTTEPILGAEAGVSGEAILGPIDGEILDQLLDLQVNAITQGHNEAFGGLAAMIPVSGPLPSFDLAGGMQLTLLGPDRTRLERLRAEWVKVIREAGRTEEEIDALVAAGARRRGLEPLLGPIEINVRESAGEPFKSERKPANGSSLVLLAEYDNKRALLTGDAFAPTIEAGVRRLLSAPTDRLTVDVMKLAHHGSRNNTSISMLQRLDCRRFLLSSSGAIFCHPDWPAVARVIVTSGPDVELGFNYNVDTTTVWDDSTLKEDAEFPFTTRYPSSTTRGLRTVV